MFTNKIRSGCWLTQFVDKYRADLFFGYFHFKTYEKYIYIPSEIRYIFSIPFSVCFSQILYSINLGLLRKVLLV